MSIPTVRDLLGVLDGAELVGAASAARRRVGGFSTDTRSLKKGEVFVALKGENFDGHGFLAVAAERGASAAIVSRSWRGLAEAAPLPLVVVDDTLEAYGVIATAHRSGFTIPVIAVAGSNGKTTTKELIADLLATRHRVLRTEGNLNNLIGVPAMMLRMSDEHTVAVIEIGTNMPGEIAKLCGILRPTHGIITNIGREHLELLGSIEGVAREEGALFEYLAASGGLAFVNLNDPHIAAMGRRLPRTVTYGRSAKADVAGKPGKLDAMGAPSLELTDRRGREPRVRSVQLHTPGLHTAQNALAAAAVALAMRIPMGEIVKTLGSFRPAIYRSGYARLAAVKAPGGATVLNDTYNSNPDSTLAALATLAAMKPGRGGRRIAVLADMKELGASSAAEHERIGREIGGMRKIDVALFHGREMRLAHEAAAAAGLGNASLFFARKEELAGVLGSMMTPADIILVKGSRGMNMEDVVRKLLTNDSDTSER
jgi:UDP-N-acetylmuramoyl-tripeptide--D-alanyl-D-alanine ligase